jgi:hypothetical protein
MKPLPLPPTSAPCLSRRSFLTGTLAAAGTLVAGPTLWSRPASASLPVRGVHLSYGADARRRMAVSWSTEQSVSRPLLEVGLDESYGQLLLAEGRSAPGVGTVYHHADVRGLEPGTRYHYRIRHDGGAPVTGTFSTAPARPAAFRFATFGDMGVGPNAALNLQRIMESDPAFCFVVGDLCYADFSGGSDQLSVLPQDPTIWDAWLAQVQASTAAAPWMSTVGNHEMERGNGELGYDGYLARFSLPDNGVTAGGVTYSFTYGNVGFVALDGNDASFEIDRNRGYLGAAQDDWLRATLTSLRADRDIDFIVVGFHNCMYCSNAFHGSDGGNRRRWEHLFDEAGVDLVVNGHNHCYERTHPVRGGVPVAEAGTGGEVDAAAGTTYLTAGGAGQAEYPTSSYPVSYVAEEGPPGVYGGIRVPETALWSATRYMQHSIAVVDVTPRDRDGAATMTVRGLAKDGAEIDRVTLRRSASAPGPGWDRRR